MSPRHALVAFVGAGCAQENAVEAAPQSPTAAAPSDPTDDADSELDSGGAALQPAYYGLDLTFEISRIDPYAPSVWLVDASRLQVAVTSWDHTLLCTLAVPILTVTEETWPSEPAGLVAWWVLDLGPAASDGAEDCPEWPARTWRLGLGPYDPRLDPQSAARGILGYDVYGLYLQETPDAPVYVIGYAATPAMLDGELDLTVDAGPLPDGRYEAASLVAMSLD